MKNELLRMARVTIEQEGVIYLDNFSLWLAKGEILGITAMNHHGIKQLVDLLMFNTPIKYGEVWFEENPVNHFIQGDKRPNKISAIDTQSRLVTGLSVTDNIFVLRKGFKKYIVQNKVLKQQVRQTFEQLRLTIRPDALVEDLTVLERCIVELVKAVLDGAKLIIIHNIGTLMSYDALINFHNLIRQYKQQEISFIYIGNHHEEVFEICTRFALYESGKIIKILYPEDMDDAHISPFVCTIKKPQSKINEDSKLLLEIKDTSTPKLSDFSCKIYAGKCTMILDKDHCMQEEIINIFQDKVMIIPEDPLNKYLFLDQSYLYNLCFQVDTKIGRSIIPQKVKKSIVKEWKDDIGEYYQATTLNGLSKEVLYNLVYYRIQLYRPQIVLMIQPFVGADMYLRVHIADLIMKLKDQGMAVLLLDSQLSDSMAICNEILLIEEGKQIASDEMISRNFVKKNYYINRFIGKLRT